MTTSTKVPTLDDAIATYEASGWRLAAKMPDRAEVASPHGPERITLEIRPDGAIGTRPWTDSTATQPAPSTPVEAKFHQATNRNPTPASIWALAGLAVLAIWICVVLAGIFAPDFVTGSQHDHIQLAWVDWIWGLVATGSVVLVATKGMRAGAFTLTPWVMLSVAVAVVWIGVVLISAFATVFVTGTDPTIIPMAAMGAPILGSLLTGFICRLVSTAFEPIQR